MRPTNEVVALIDNAKAMGISKLEIDGVTYHLEKTNPTKPMPEELSAEEVFKPLSVLDDLSDEEVLYWSTPYGEELEDKKQSAKFKDE